MTSQIVLKVVRLRFHSMTYSRENEDKGGYLIKKRLSEY